MITFDVYEAQCRKCMLLSTCAKLSKKYVHNCSRFEPRDARCLTPYECSDCAGCERSHEEYNVD